MMDVKFTSNQTRIVNDFGKKKGLKVEWNSNSVELKRLSDAYCFITKEKGGKFSVGGCAYDQNVTLTEALKLANNNL